MARFGGRHSSHLLQQQQQNRNQHYSHPLINVPSTRPPPQIPPMPRTTSTVIRKTLVHPGLTCDAACRKKTKHYRALLDDYLNCIGKDWDMPSLRMNHQTGICAFQYRNFIICIEVPFESACFFLYTCVLLLDTTTATTTTTRTNPTTTTTTTGFAVVMRRALELNYLTQTTRGCTLSMDPTTKDDEGDALQLTLSYSQPILGLAKGEFCTIVVNFLDTAQQLQQQLLQCCPEEEEEERVGQQQQVQQLERSSSLISSSACSSSSCFVPSTSDGDCERSAYSLLTPTPHLPHSTARKQHKESSSSCRTKSRRKTFRNRPTSSPGIAESHVPRFLNAHIVTRKSCDTLVGRVGDSFPMIFQEDDKENVTHEAAPPSPPAVYRTRCAKDVELPAGQIRPQRTTFTKTTKALHWTRKSAAASNNPAVVAGSSTPKAHHLCENKEEPSRSCRRPEGSSRPRTEAPGGPTKRFAYPPSVLSLAKMEQGSIRT
jgi:hypothetical protein